MLAVRGCSASGEWWFCGWNLGTASSRAPAVPRLLSEPRKPPYERVHKPACLTHGGRIVVTHRRGQPIRETEMRKEARRCETNQLDDAPVIHAVFFPPPNTKIESLLTDPVLNGNVAPATHPHTDP